ncbi:MAG: hypothetical protein ABIF09_19355 [Gemmatimonadota bacterium]
MMVVLAAVVVGPARALEAAWALGAALQATPGMAPLPADPPIGGPIWTVVIPALLLIGSFLATFFLYKRFAQEEGE